MTYYYNYLNLQHKIIGAESDTLYNLYGADGTLLQRKYKKANTIVYKKDYINNNELRNDVLESIYHNDGRFVKDGSVFKYEYWIKDHLGNVRVTFTDDNGNGLLVSEEIRSRNDYYPFGMEMNSRWKFAETYHLLNQKKYNGKEWVNDMNIGQLLYGKRPYNPILGRFESTDPISHMFPSLSSYNYASNNPIRNIDLHGLQGVDAVAGALAGNDDEGYITTATATQREDSPSLAGIQDGAFAILNFIGFNAIDNAFFGSKPTTTAQKVAAVAPVLFNTKGTVNEGVEGAIKANTTKTKTYQTYTKEPLNLEDGVYSGKTSGYGTPRENIAKRDKNHHMNSTHKPAKLDKSSKNPDAIRGREQHLIDSNGGAQSDGGTSGNAIRSVSKLNKRAQKYKDANKKEFGDD